MIPLTVRAFTALIHYSRSCDPPLVPAVTLVPAVPAVPLVQAVPLEPAVLLGPAVLLV